MSDQDMADHKIRREKLSDEITEAQKARSDLLKWKILLIAVLGGTGLGLMEKGKPTPLLLALIPFVCLYVDLLCTNLNIRILAIGMYFATFLQDTYEGFIGKVRHIFALEDWALFGSTIFASWVVIIIGIIIIIGANADGCVFRGLVLIICGLMGHLGSFIIRKRYQNCTDFRTFPGPIGECVVHNKELMPFLRFRYSIEDLEALRQRLIYRGAFRFQTLPNGLFPAAGSAQSSDLSGYQFTWVRDNIHIAYAQYATGNSTAAVRAVTAIMNFYQKYEYRFQKIIDRKSDPSEPMNRPHVRFDGAGLNELEQQWPHAQNDALGYFLWLYCKLARKSHIECDDAALSCLQLFPRYFRAIGYWSDQDSGHWEEAQKVEASSIGVVIAGLREMKMLLSGGFVKGKVDSSLLDTIEKLIEDGSAALKKILPCESRDPDDLFRPFDAALLFLIFPLEVEEVMKDHLETILHDVTTYLQAEHGIRRYTGDSYWCADYKEKFPRELWTADLSKNPHLRDKLLLPGEEAQWCIFDPIISIIYGRLCAHKMGSDPKGALELHRRQTYYLNRALGQITGEEKNISAFRCPEAYYLRKNRYVPNDQTPLLWTQANLWLSLHVMHGTVQMMEDIVPDAGMP